MDVNQYSQVWNLDTLFTGGSESSQLYEHIRQLEAKIYEFEEKLIVFNTPKKISESIKMAALIDFIGDIRINLSQVNSFLTCLLAQNPKDQNAKTLQGKTTVLSTRFESACNKVKIILVKTNQCLWESLLNTDHLANYKFILNEWREEAKTQLSDEEQDLVLDLMVDGYH
ncbi:hypothetical protein V7024_23335 [Bacillus sp. JJ864]|uniref:hypothetical protein n=1 Tax=Bacillus sp. JJ864 TaxID=3122975 RepID=UPI002FFDD852